MAGAVSRKTGDSIMTGTGRTEREGTPRVYFGDERVAPEEKRRRVLGVFRSVAERYDLMNDLMSAGVHRLWKASFIDSLAPRPGMRILDVAGGTGDIAFRALRAADGKARIRVLDINEAMLAVGRARARERGFEERLDWICADAERLPIRDRSQDAYTIAFGIRNVADRAAALAEAHRVLRFGGHFLCLEFSQVALPLLDRLYARYSAAIIPRLGEWITGDRDSYDYLVRSIARFPAADDFADEIRAAGFARVRHRLLSGGICAVHEGWKV